VAELADAQDLGIADQVTARAHQTTLTAAIGGSYGALTVYDTVGASPRFPLGDLTFVDRRWTADGQRARAAAVREGEDLEGTAGGCGWQGSAPAIECGRPRSYRFASR
jgi:hypothetical protein